MYLLFKEITLLYNVQYRVIASYQLVNINQNHENESEKMDINHFFYEGFGM